MRLSNQLLHSHDIENILDFAPLGVLAENCVGEILWMNQTLAWQLGVDVDDLIGKPASALPLQPVFGARGRRWFHVADSPEESQVLRKLKCIEDVLPDYNQEGIRVRYFQEVSEERSMRFSNDLLQLMRQAPSLDSCTGLIDESSIVQTLRTEVARSRRYGNPLSIVVLEIRLKREVGPVINHPSRVLMHISRLLRESTRWADTLGRSNEREFLLVLPETSASAARKLVRKIQRRLNDPADDIALHFDSHFGVVEWCRGDDPMSLLDRAKSALGITANA